MTEAAKEHGTGGGQVEREARQLVEAAARWLSAVPNPQDTRQAEPDRDEPVDRADEPVDRADEPVDRATHAGAASADTHEEHLCRGCPWCRAKAAFGGSAGADTLESIAHLLGAAAESLTLFAQARREAARPAADQMQHDESKEDDMADAVIWVDDDDELDGETEGQGQSR